MKFSIGDKVVLKRTGEEGHVVAYINKQMIEVEVNGTSFPVYTDEVDHPYLKWFTEKKTKPTIPNKSGQATGNKYPEQLPVEKAKQRPVRLAKGVYLSFIPVFKPNTMEDIVEQLKIHLLNELPQTVHFHYEVKLLQKTLFKLEGKLHGFGNIYLHSIDFGDMNDQPRFHWRLDDLEHPEMKAEEGIVRIRPDKLFRHVSDMLQNNEPSFSYQLISEFLPFDQFAKQKLPEKLDLPKPASSRPGNAQPPIGGGSYEIDLHIENLVSNTRGLSNADMLQIQLTALQHALQQALVNRQERLMVIHGLGRGVLRDEVHRVLDETPGVLHYVNEWQGKYGFGATEVFFDYLG